MIRLVSRTQWHNDLECVSNVEVINRLASSRIARLKAVFLLLERFKFKKLAFIGFSRQFMLFLLLCYCINFIVFFSNFAVF